jgi:hypothetical protein
MSEYEYIDHDTGEIIEYRSQIDLSLLEAYNQWVTDKRLAGPPLYTPKEYAEHVDNELAKLRVSKAIEFIETYNMGTVWEPAMIDSLLEILKNAKE